MKNHLWGPTSSFYTQGHSQDPGISGTATCLSDSWTSALLQCQVSLPSHPTRLITKCPTTPCLSHRVIKMSNSHFELKQMCTLTLLSANAAPCQANPSPVCSPYYIPHSCQIWTKRFLKPFKLRCLCRLVQLIAQLTLCLLDHWSINRPQLWLHSRIVLF